MNVNNKLILQRCQLKRCKQCDIGYIIKDYVKPIFQLITDDITDYNMRLLTTKCLNTAIVLSYCLLGPLGIKRAGYCDTQNVIDRHEKGIDNNRTILDNLKLDILDKTLPGRYIYYILITDAYFPYDNSSKSEGFFCGHVLLLERIPNGEEPFYYFYQSYINQYDFKGHYERNKGTLKMSWERVKNILENLDYTIMNGKWDEKVVNFWKDFTFVDTNDIKGSNSKGKLFLCYRRTPATECVKYLEDYSKEKLDYINKIPREQMNDIYGDETRYNSRQTPMTNGEIKTCLEKLLQQIDLNRNNL
jgi:hypothetical protein